MLPSPELKLILDLLHDDANNTVHTYNQNSAINWDCLLQLIIRHRIAPQIFNHIQNLQDVWTNPA